MHVLICAPAAASGPSDERADALAGAWASAAPHCTVEALELDAPAAAGEAPSGAAPAEPKGVFVPVTSLGLASASEHVPPRVARLRERVRGADLAVVHVGTLDGAALRTGPVAAVADAAAPYAVPVVVVADAVAVTRREWSAAGVSGVHELADAAATRGDALARVARTWTPVWSVSSR